MRQIPHPEDLFDRQQEWAELSAFVTDPTPGLRIGIVYGRRRQGKSYLLRRLAVATGGFYYQALEHEPAQARADLGERLGSHLGVGRLALADWPEAISALRGLAPRRSGLLGDALVGSSLMGGGSNVNGPAVAVLDEFPYLLERSPELPSLLQRAVDPSREQNWPAVRLILCGSAISVMADLLEGKGPLRGRGHTNLVMRPFDHLDARIFWNISDLRLAFRMHATLGGTPAYRDLVPSIPKSLKGFDSWVVNDVLSPASLP
ncbi:MAG: AAA family ATPase [Acidimicrobiales bacterium]